MQNGYTLAERLKPVQNFSLENLQIDEVAKKYAQKHGGWKLHTSNLRVKDLQKHPRSRSEAAVVSYLEELNLREVGDYGITYNGGLVQRTDTGEVLSKKTLTKVEIEEIFALSKEINVPCNFIDLEKIYEEDKKLSSIIEYKDSILENKFPDLFNAIKNIESK